MCICSFEFTNAQNKNINWTFGDSAGINFSNFNQPTTFITSAKSRGSCASISDSAGSLLFYYAYDPNALLGGSLYNGNVYDKNNQIMQNGDYIVTLAWYYEGIIIPIPNETDKYYLFNIGVATKFGLYYSIIDMSLNNGLGAVTQKNIPINNLDANDGLTAVQHGNGRDWWLLFRKYDGVWDNTFYKYLIDINGVTCVDTQNIGFVYSTNSTRYVFNKLGNKLAGIYYNGHSETFDFDRCTGQLSNNIVLKTNGTTLPPDENLSCEFSDNGRFLYIATSGYYNAAYLIQVDLLNPQLYAAADTIDSINYVLEPGGQLKRGPDDKIYWACGYTDGFNFPYPYPDTLYNTYNTYLSVINSPDSLGAACNFTPYSFYLGGARTYWGLPNNPDYDLGPLKGSPCDTLQWVGTPETPKPPLGGLNAGLLQCTYISAWEKLFVNASGLKGKNVTVSIYDATGKQKYVAGKSPKGDLGVHSGYATVDVDCTGWANGLYVVHLQTEVEMLSCKFVKE